MTGRALGRPSAAISAGPGCHAGWCRISEVSRAPCQDIATRTLTHNLYDLRLHSAYALIVRDYLE
jgi:hypothetical protein